jgi:hypothetical protein
MLIDELSVPPTHELLLPISHHISAPSRRQMTKMCNYSFTIYEQELKPA